MHSSVPQKKHAAVMRIASLTSSEYHINDQSASSVCFAPKLSPLFSLQMNTSYKYSYISTLSMPPKRAFYDQQPNHAVDHVSATAFINTHQRETRQRYINRSDETYVYLTFWWHGHAVALPWQCPRHAARLPWHPTATQGMPCKPTACRRMP